MPHLNIAILAKAPVAGLSKTRLIPAIGAHAAAVLQERMTERTVATTLAAQAGPVTVWCAPDPGHVSFRDLCKLGQVTLKRQAEGDIGERMLAAFVAHDGPTVLIGSDCPAFTPEHLRTAGQALRDGNDVVLTPAEDGGYVLIGAQQPRAELFEGMVWSTPSVLADTRERIAALGLRCVEMPALWDVDTERDLDRLEREVPEMAL